MNFSQIDYRMFVNGSLTVIEFFIVLLGLPLGKQKG